MSDFIKEIILSIGPVFLTGFVVHRYTNKYNIYKSEIEIKHQKIKLINVLERILDNLESRENLRNSSDIISEAFDKMSVGDYSEYFEELRLDSKEENKSDCIEYYMSLRKENTEMQQKNQRVMNENFSRFKELPKNLIDAKSFKIIDNIEYDGIAKMNSQQVKEIINSLS